MFPIGIAIVFSFWRRKLFKFRNVSSELMFIILLSFSLVTASVGDKSENITSDNGNATSDVTEVISNNENLEENHTVAADENRLNYEDERGKDETVLHGLRLMKTSSKMNYDEDGVLIVSEMVPLTLEIYGINLDQVIKAKFTTAEGTAGGICTSSSSHYQSEEVSPVLLENGMMQIELPEGLQYHQDDNIYYLCVKLESERRFLHQGDSDPLMIIVTSELLPEWFKAIVVVGCLMLSGMFSGLNLGLMSLDRTELQILVNSGSEKERSYATSILPVRIHGNFLLCSILLGNVLVNNSLTIVLDSLLDGGGAIAVVFATLAIVIFGEIIPQALCSRHGLAIGARTIWLMKFFMFLTSPLSYPLSKLLDYLLGAELGTVYNKQKLMELLKVTDGMNDLDKDEVDMVTGALVLSKKNVKDVMTKLEDCYMLPLDKHLDFETVSEIKSQGYSRIPVYKQEKENVVYILLAKDLLFLDTEDEKTVEEVCKFYENAPNFVYDDTVLTDMFNEFKTGDKGHMAIVQAINNEGEGDPFYQTIGLVTLEDIIEEIIQSEIVDETDVVTDNKSKKKRKSRYRKEADLKLFGHKTHNHVHISPQMSLAVLQFLSANVKPFYPDRFNQRILQKLLSMDVYRVVKINSLKLGELSNPEEGVIMKRGVPCDFFVLVIEGKVEITIGKEDKIFHEGPFSCFGEKMLEQEQFNFQNWSVNSANNSERSLSITSSKVSTWVPDYNLKAITDLMYLKIRRGIYQLAIKANKLKVSNSESEANIKELDLVETLLNETKSDADFELQSTCYQSPEKLRDCPASKDVLKKSYSSPKTGFSADSGHTVSQDTMTIEKVDLSRSLTEERISDRVISDRSITTSPTKGLLSDNSLSKGSKDNNKVMFILSDAEDSPETASLLHSEHKVS